LELATLLPQKAQSERAGSPGSGVAVAVDTFSARAARSSLRGEGSDWC